MSSFGASPEQKSHSWCQCRSSMSWMEVCIRAIRWPFKRRWSLLLEPLSQKQYKWVARFTSSWRRSLLRNLGHLVSVPFTISYIAITDNCIQATGVGHEGGFAPPISQPHEALDLLVEAVSLAGYTGRIKFAIDPASSEFFRNGNYDIGFKDDKPNLQSPKQLAELYRSLLQNYPIVLLEDPFAETDWDSWIEFNKNCPIELVGDDLLVTNTKYVQEANDKRACNSMLLKINQIGTISEAIEALVSLRFAPY